MKYNEIEFKNLVATECFSTDLFELVLEQICMI
jgi:hypothetical protein